MALANVDCRQLGVEWYDREKEEVSLCVARKGKDPICKDACINYGQDGKLSYFGVDCENFGLEIDNRTPFEKRMDEKEQNFGRAEALCAFGDRAACKYRRGDPWPP